MLTIGKVTAGDAPNIIPDQAQLQGTLRCDSEKEREFILQRLSEVVDAVAKMYRGSATITMLAGTPPLILRSAVGGRFCRIYAGTGRAGTV